MVDCYSHPSSYHFTTPLSVEDTTTIDAFDRSFSSHLNSTAKKSPLPAILIVAVLLGAIAGVYVLSSGDDTPSNTDSGDDMEQNNGEDPITDGSQGNETVDTARSVLHFP